nr:immunoglobulin heavy chain junction region [Mus musculus]
CARNYYSNYFDYW